MLGEEGTGMLSPLLSIRMPLLAASEATGGFRSHVHPVVTDASEGPEGSTDMEWTVLRRRLVGGLGPGMTIPFTSIVPAVTGIIKPQMGIELRLGPGLGCGR